MNLIRKWYTRIVLIEPPVLPCCLFVKLQIDLPVPITITNVK